MANRFPLVFDAAGDKQIKELPTGDNLNLLGSSIVDVVNVNASGTIVADTITVNNINASGGSIAAVAISNDYNDLDNKPTLFSGDYNDLTNKPASLANDWADITNKPVIPTKLSQLVNDTNFASENSFIVNATNIAGLASIATSGSFTDLSDVPDFVTQAEIVDGTLTIDVNNTGDLNGRLIADDGDRVVYDNTTDRFNSPKVSGEIQWIGQGNDALTKIFAEDSRVIINSASTRSLMLQNYQQYSGEFQNRGITLKCHVDEEIFGTTMQLQIGDASGAADRAVKVMGEFYTDGFGDFQITDITLGGIYDFPEILAPIQPLGKGQIWRLKSGYFETLDTNNLIVNNDLELKGHITSDDSTILVDTEQGKFFGNLEGDVVGSVFADDSSIMVDAVNNRLSATTLVGNVEKNGSAMDISSDSGINFRPGGFLSIPNATTITASASSTISIAATGNLTLSSNTGKVKITGSVPSTSIGVTGDEEGMVAFDGTYMYYCTADYDGIANVWKRVAWSGDTW
jgi:hypothetical protein